MYSHILSLMTCLNHLSILISIIGFMTKYNFFDVVFNTEKKRKKISLCKKKRAGHCCPRSMRTRTAIVFGKHAIRSA